MKKFIIIGNMNAITCKEIFPLIKENKLWWGASKGIGGKFVSIVDGQRMAQVNNACWFTNVEHKKRHTPIDLYKRYSNEYPHYDNYDAIEVSKVCDIPMDYDGVMGVPVSFLSQHNPTQFEIVGATQRGCHNDFPDTKKYDDYKEVRRSDNVETGSSGNKTNENAVMLGIGNKKHYFKNKEGRCVFSEYSRLFIRKIK